MQRAASESIMSRMELYHNAFLPEPNSGENQTLQIIIASYTIRHLYQRHRSSVHRWNSPISRCNHSFTQEGRSFRVNPVAAHLRLASLDRVLRLRFQTPDPSWNSGKAYVHLILLPPWTAWSNIRPQTQVVRYMNVDVDSTNSMNHYRGSSQINESTLFFFGLWNI
jgi:hypothetical protein